MPATSMDIPVDVTSGIGRESIVRNDAVARQRPPVR